MTSTSDLEPNRGKLSSRNHRGTQRATVWLTPRSLKQLEWLLEFYFRVLGEQPVSTSLVIRRSLELCKEHIRQVLSEGDREKVLREGDRIRQMR